MSRSIAFLCLSLSIAAVSTVSGKDELGDLAERFNLPRIRELVDNDPKLRNANRTVIASQVRDLIGLGAFERNVVSPEAVVQHLREAQAAKPKPGQSKPKSAGFGMFGAKPMAHQVQGGPPGGHFFGSCGLPEYSGPHFGAFGGFGEPSPKKPVAFGAFLKTHANATKLNASVADFLRRNAGLLENLHNQYSQQHGGFPGFAPFAAGHGAPPAMGKPGQHPAVGGFGGFPGGHPGAGGFGGFPGAAGFGAGFGAPRFTEFAKQTKEKIGNKTIAQVLAQFGPQIDKFHEKFLAAHPGLSASKPGDFLTFLKNHTAAVANQTVLNFIRQHPEVIQRIHQAFLAHGFGPRPAQFCGGQHPGFLSHFLASHKNITGVNKNFTAFFTKNAQLFDRLHQGFLQAHKPGNTSAANYAAHLQLFQHSTGNPQFAAFVRQHAAALNNAHRNFLAKGWHPAGPCQQHHATPCGGFGGLHQCVGHAVGHDGIADHAALHRHFNPQVHKPNPAAAALAFSLHRFIAVQTAAQQASCHLIRSLIAFTAPKGKPHFPAPVKKPGNFTAPKPKPPTGPVVKPPAGPANPPVPATPVKPPVAPVPVPPVKPPVAAPAATLPPTPGPPPTPAPPGLPQTPPPPPPTPGPNVIKPALAPAIAPSNPLIANLALPTNNQIAGQPLVMPALPTINQG